MKKYMYRVLMLPLIASIALVSCSDEEDTPTPATPSSPVDGKVMVASGTSAEAEVDIKVYADQDLFVGYNKLYTMIYKQGTDEVIADGHVTYMPMMKMGSGMEHTCPVEQPSSTSPDDEVYDGAIIPIMPSGEMGSWTLEVHVHNHSNNKEGHAKMPITVGMVTDARQYSFVNEADGMSYFVTMIEPSNPEIGINDYEVAIHMRENMMSFPAVTNSSVEIEPEMPTMGHGSPNNENPVHMEMGHYLGKVNFTMSGYWKINMTIKDQGGTVMDADNSFDVNF